MATDVASAWLPSLARDALTALKALLVALLVADLTARAVIALQNQPAAPSGSAEGAPLVGEAGLCAPLRLEGSLTLLRPPRAEKMPKKQAHALLHATAASLSAALSRVSATHWRTRTCRVERVMRSGSAALVSVCSKPPAGSARRQPSDCACFELPHAELLAAAAALVGYPRRGGSGTCVDSRGERGGTNRTTVGAALAHDACERLARNGRGGPLRAQTPRGGAGGLRSGRGDGRGSVAGAAGGGDYGRGSATWSPSSRRASSSLGRAL